MPLSIFIALVAAGVVLLFVYQNRLFRYKQELLKAEMEAREETVLHIGQGLHDNVGQLLTSARFLLGVTGRSLPEVPDTLLAADETLAGAIRDLRSLSHTLSRDWLQEFDLLDNLRSEIARINALGRVHAALDVAEPGLPLKRNQQVLLFRIIQEGLQNVLQHADASVVIVYISLHSDQLRVAIADNGKGGDRGYDAVSGVNSMERRAALLGGTIRWDVSATHGVSVRIVVPLKVS